MDDLIDKDLRDVLGDRYTERFPEEKEIPSDAEYEEISQDHSFLKDLKYPAFFLGFGIFIGWSGHMELMDAVLAIPGMCICAACFGWHVKGMSK